MNRKILKQIDFMYNLSFNKVVEIVKEYLKITGKTYKEIKANEEYKGIKIGFWKNSRRHPVVVYLNPVCPVNRNRVVIISSKTRRRAITSMLRC